MKIQRLLKWPLKSWRLSQLPGHYALLIFTFSRGWAKIALLCVLGLVSWVHSDAVYAVGDRPTIEVIYSDATPLQGVQSLKRQGLRVSLLNLDDGKRLVDKITVNLPPNQKAAKQQLEQRLQAASKAQVRAQFTQAFQAIIVSTRYGLTRYPAVVFNHGQAVVYGVTDLPRAVSLYHQWRGKP